MEPPLGAISEFDWNAVLDEPELMMAQLLGTCQGKDAMESMFRPDYDYDASCGLYWPSTDDTASTGNFFFPTTDQFDSYELGDATMIPAMETSLSEEQITTSTLPIDYNNNNSIAEVHTPQRKRKIVEYVDIGNEDKVMTENDPKKKARASTQVQKSAKNARWKKAQKSVAKEESNASCCPEDNSNASQEPTGDGDGDGTSSSTKGKRGSATDPQSLYARKRRERINERLKTLQNLVPNETKVDISTMLEEAVQYVKFLQLQIKILSSDDMWMYAPLASNGMDIGLDLKLHFPQQRQ